MAKLQKKEQLFLIYVYQVKHGNPKITLHPLIQKMSSKTGIPDFLKWLWQVKADQWFSAKGVCTVLKLKPGQEWTQGGSHPMPSPWVLLWKNQLEETLGCNIFIFRFTRWITKPTFCIALNLGSANKSKILYSNCNFLKVGIHKGDFSRLFSIPITMWPSILLLLSRCWSLMEHSYLSSYFASWFRWTDWICVTALSWNVSR